MDSLNIFDVLGYDCIYHITKSMNVLTTIMFSQTCKIAQYYIEDIVTTVENRKLRNKQSRVLFQALEKFQTQHCVSVCAETGFGKTTIAYGVIEQLIQYDIIDRAIILVPNQQLEEYWFTQAVEIGLSFKAPPFSKRNVIDEYRTRSKVISCSSKFTDDDLFQFESFIVCPSSIMFNRIFYNKILRGEFSNRTLIVLDESHIYHINSNYKSWHNINTVIPKIKSNKYLLLSANETRSDIYVPPTFSKFDLQTFPIDTEIFNQYQINEVDVFHLMVNVV